MYCSNCGAPLPTRPAICPSCGAEITYPRESANAAEQKDSETGDQYQLRYFDIPAERLNALLAYLMDWLREESFQYQRLQTEDGATLLQIVKKGGWRKLLGMDAALNIVCRPTKQGLEVKIGAGKWLDKAVAGGVGMVLLWPLAITAGIGAYEQMQLPERIYEKIATFEEN